MMKKVLVLLVFLSIDAVFGQCPPGCGYPSVWANFTTTIDGSTIQDIQKSLKWWFPTGNVGTSPVKPPTVLYNNLNDADPEFIIQNPTKIRFTLLSEAAGIQNQAGIFFYTRGPTGNITVTKYQLILPHVEKGCIPEGATVSTDILPTGTRFGFYLIPDGYCQPATNTKWHSIPSLNNVTDIGRRHIAVYYDKKRDVYVMGWDDLSYTDTRFDGDFDDNVFMIDSTGTPIQALNIPTVCSGGCLNGGVCDYATGDCQCINGHYGPNCAQCSCDDHNPCTQDTCMGPSTCNQTDYRINELCIASQYCKNDRIECPTFSFTRRSSTQTPISTVVQETAQGTTTENTPTPIIVKVENSDANALIGVAATLAFVSTVLIILIVFLVLRYRRGNAYARQTE
eukprot:TRINITY_DN2118_c0_g2_i1.p1 TRINITY_DN2118_c0_g2~~TRINITY_DN2118_c0_g2_i1.p1  ORF type:complete len:396 (-),score=96.33 TRINITY_DN2118_c0_g2_i1:76-1263(-)